MSETVALDMDWYDGETNEYQSNLYPGTNANGIPNTYHQVSPPEIHHPVSESPFPGNLGSHTIPNPRQHLVNNTTTQQNFFVPKFNHSSAAEQGEDTSEEEEPLLYGTKLPVTLFLAFLLSILCHIKSKYLSTVITLRLSFIV